jgi:pimeloyl-ACP methyl ester carboxylesterase
MKGLSTADPSDLSAEILINDLLYIINHYFPKEKVVLAGHSMGGYLII